MHYINGNKAFGVTKFSKLNRRNKMTQTNNKPVNTENHATHFVNGVNLDTLMGTVNAIQAEPTLGSCHFRATNKWVDGAFNQSKITGFYGAKQEIAHKQTFNLVADEPAILAGNDEGANPVEHLLHALASCLTTSMVAHAAVRGIEIDEIESELEGDLDLNGFLGLSPETPKGFTRIQVNFRVKASPQDLQKIESLAAFSPVMNTLVSGVPVQVSVDAK
jgi:uncharacterized OsmC-like protein